MHHLSQSQSALIFQTIKRFEKGTFKCVDNKHICGVVPSISTRNESHHV